MNKENPDRIVFTNSTIIETILSGGTWEFKCNLNYSDLIEYLKLAQSDGIEDIHAIIGSLRYYGDFSMSNGIHIDESYQP